jgi:hypothetical protein
MDLDGAIKEGLATVEEVQIRFYRSGHRGAEKRGIE